MLVHTVLLLDVVNGDMFAVLHGSSYGSRQISLALLDLGREEIINKLCERERGGRNNTIYLCNIHG